VEIFALTPILIDGELFNIKKECMNIKVVMIMILTAMYVVTNIQSLIADTDEKSAHLRTVSVIFLCSALILVGTF